MCTMSKGPFEPQSGKCFDNLYCFPQSVYNRQFHRDTILLDPSTTGE